VTTIKLSLELQLKCNVFNIVLRFDDTGGIVRFDDIGGIVRFDDIGRIVRFHDIGGIVDNLFLNFHLIKG
jgi:hypothetical protein